MYFQPSNAITFFPFAAAVLILVHTSINHISMTSHARQHDETFVYVTVVDYLVIDYTPTLLCTVWQLKQTVMFSTVFAKATASMALPPVWKVTSAKLRPRARKWMIQTKLCSPPQHN